MIQDDKLEKICTDFSKLSGEQQDYIIGIMQALVFANSTQTGLTDAQMDARQNNVDYHSER
ncbi:MAG: hypothetical protein FWC17_03990 [Treponema sp.]|nr:hypothetical protein [Treponema sp.]